MKLSKLNHCAGSTVINGAPQSVTSWFCGSSVILGALWRGQYGSPNFSSLTSPPPSTPHKCTDLHPLSLLHPQPTGKCLLSYCAFCKTWLNLINAVDFKQNCIWAVEREKERGNSQKPEQISPVRSLRGLTWPTVCKYSTLFMVWFHGGGILQADIKEVDVWGGVENEHNSFSVFPKDTLHERKKKLEWNWNFYSLDSVHFVFCFRISFEASKAEFEPDSEFLNDNK